MPDPGPRRERTAKIETATRQANHAGIDRLAEDLLPALIAKLGTTNLGELEVREGEWHVRLRRPYGAVPGEGRRAVEINRIGARDWQREFAIASPPEVDLRKCLPLAS